MYHLFPRVSQLYRFRRIQPKAAFLRQRRCRIHSQRIALVKEYLTIRSTRSCGNCPRAIHGEFNEHNCNIRIGLRGPRVWRRRLGLSNLAARVCQNGNSCSILSNHEILLTPQHGEIRVDCFLVQIEPNLKENQFVFLFLFATQRHHLAVHNSVAGGDPLSV